MTEIANFKRNTSLMAAGTAISRVTGFGRTIALTYAIGSGAFAGTYLLANNVPTIIYELVVGGVLSATLVPVFTHHFASEKNEDDAWQAVSAVFVAVLAVITVLTALVLLAAPFIIDLYTLLNDQPSADAQKETATYLLRLFAPQIAIYGFISVATGLLHARRRFAPPMFAPILNNIIVISVLLALPHISNDLSLEGMRNDTAGLTFLGIGTTAGVLGMGLVLLPFLRKTTAGQLRLRPDFKHPAVHKVLRLSGWTIGFVIANQIAFWVTIVLAGRNEADVAAFLIAYQFFILPHGILSVSVMSALQPELAERWSRGAVEEFKSTVATGIRILTTVIAPIAILLSVLAQPMISFVFENGRTTESAGSTLAWVVALMLIGLPGFSLFLFFTRVLQSMQDARSVFWLYLVQNGLNIATAIPLYHYMGVGGLALSQSVAYACAALVAFSVIRARAGRIGGRALAGSVIRIAIATLLMAGAAAGTRKLLESAPDFVQLVATGLAGVAILIGLLRLIAPSEFALLLRLPKRNRSAG